MPMRDHFHPPMTKRFPWNELHLMWPMGMVRYLRTLLPPGFRSAPNVRVGGPFKVDVSTFDERSFGDRADEGSGGSATLAVASPTLTFETELVEPDEFEVRIYEDDEYGRTLVAAVEFVSPSNKDRSDTRQQFAAKTIALLQQGVCVCIVDPVTSRHSNLYAEVLEGFGRSDPSLGAEPSATYAATLRARKPPKTGKQPNPAALLDAWYYPMVLGEPLPTIPLWLSPIRKIDLALETSYEEACLVLGMA